MSKIDDALEWMLADKTRGYKKAAKQFGVDVSELKRARMATRSVEKSQTTTGPISRAEFEAWAVANPLSSSVATCLRDLRPNEKHTKNDGSGEYDRVWRFMKDRDEAPPKVEPTDPTEDRREWAVEALSLVEADLANERARRHPSANGIASLLRMAREYRNMVDLSTVNVGDELDTMTPAEQKAWLRLQAEGLTDEHLEVLMRVYTARAGIQLLSVHEGYRSELTDDGWKQIV